MDMLRQSYSQDEFFSESFWIHFFTLAVFLIHLEAEIKH